ncbi:MAG: tRNA(Ile)-lysidine synthetase, partial [Clostridia bacterium]|nr:tRNA(Ile)-lysidine synthetase [Clostridia bacterium]
MININKKLLPRDGRVLAALSGGADSVCLLHQLYGQRHELGLTVIAAHYSHGIRTECAAD